MTPSTLTRVLSGLEEIAGRLDDAERCSKSAATAAVGRADYWCYAFGWINATAECAADDLRKDIKLLRESLGGDTDGTSLD